MTTLTIERTGKKGKKKLKVKDFDFDTMKLIS